MFEEFKRYCALQRDQAPLAQLMIYLKRKGGWVQLNTIWKDLGPTSGGPFWNQTTLINKLNKLEKLKIIEIDRKILPSERLETKKKTNTFCKLNVSSPVCSSIYSMLKIKQDPTNKFSSNLHDKPLDKLISNIGTSGKTAQDALMERKLEVAMELIGEVFDIDGPEVKEMIRDRLIKRGLIENEDE
jgi:hypothetical protein